MPSEVIAVAILAVALLTLVRTRLTIDVVFLLATLCFYLAGIITVEDFRSGFASSALFTVAALFVVARGLRETGAINWIADFLGSTVREESAYFRRVALITGPMSAFVNNTPVVAIITPIVSDWCKRNRLPPSRLLMPIAFMTTLGGVCTLIGTSTNVILAEMVSSMSPSGSGSGLVRQGMTEFHFLELSVVGVPYALIGAAYIMLARSRIPLRLSPLQGIRREPREYLVEMVIGSDSPIVGKSVENAGLRQLEGLFLASVVRSDQTITPVSPELVLHAEDRLVLTGLVENVAELKKIPGLSAAPELHNSFGKHGEQATRLWEVVISDTSPLIGKSIRDAQFRARYNASVLAVHRRGAAVHKKIGDIIAQPGDTLIIQTGIHFRRAFRNHKDFFLVSDVPEWRPQRNHLRSTSALIFVAMCAAMISGVSPMIATVTAALGMIVTGCLTPSEARQSIDWSILITIGAATAVGAGVEASGLAAVVASHIAAPFGLSDLPIFITLLLLFYGTCCLTELMTNNAAAVLMLPISLTIASQLGADPRPFVVTLMLAASASFITPVGYQTNLMVFGPGGYRFRDFVKFGTPLSLILGIVAASLVPLIWQP